METKTKLKREMSDVAKRFRFPEITSSPKGYYCGEPMGPLAHSGSYYSEAQKRGHK